MSQEAGARDALERQEARTRVTPSASLVAMAGMVMLGNLLGSVLGLVRLQVINATFGQSAAAGAFFAALKTPQQLSDLMIGGAVGAALIPIFVDAAPQRRADLAQLFAQLTMLLAVVMIGAMLLLWLVAPSVVPRLNAGFAPHDQQLTVVLVTLLAPLLVAQGLLAVATSALYALRRPLWPALTTGSVHLGAIAGTLLLGPRWGVMGLAIGVTVGSFGQLALLLPALRSQGLLQSWHVVAMRPEVRKCLQLALPASLGMGVSIVFQQLDQWLQSRTLDPATGLHGGPNVAALASATMLIQFPAGIVAGALAFAALPSLARALATPEQFTAIAQLGLRLGVFLMAPITVIYLCLSEPMVALLLQHHAFHHADTARTALALRAYAWQLPALAVEQVATAAFFALKAVRTPVLIGIAAIGGYLIVALPLVRAVGMPALAAANATQHCCAALMLLLLLQRRVPVLTRKMGMMAARVLLGALAMAGVCLGAAQALPLRSTTLLGQVLSFGVPLCAGILTYGLVTWRLGAHEPQELLQAVFRRGS